MLAACSLGSVLVRPEAVLRGQDPPALHIRIPDAYDVEVSGFPSSHAGHLCLLRLKEDDYPGTTQ